MAENTTLDNHTEILYQAYERGRQKHPEASAAQHAAFANAVAYLVTGASGGFGGPSMREHLACREKHYMVGCCSREEAIDAVFWICYGPITVQHAYMLQVEYCFDDSEEDRQEAERILNQQNY